MQTVRSSLLFDIDLVQLHYRLISLISIGHVLNHGHHLDVARWERWSSYEELQLRFNVLENSIAFVQIVALSSFPLPSFTFKTDEKTFHLNRGLSFCFRRQSITLDTIAVLGQHSCLKCRARVYSFIYFALIVQRRFVAMTVTHHRVSPSLYRTSFSSNFD